MTTAGLLLAAGAGRRMGGPKALLELDGQRLVERGIALLTAGGCTPVVVVLGAQASAVQPHCAGARTVVAADWAEGMAASLRAGLEALAELDGVEGCVVALVDQPLVQPGAVRRLLAAPGPAAVATYGGRARNPVRLDAAVWEQVRRSAIGDVGARAWLHAHPESVHEVDCTDVGAPDDLDVPADLAALGVSVPTSDKVAP